MNAWFFEKEVDPAAAETAPFPANPLHCAALVGPFADEGAGVFIGPQPASKVTAAAKINF